MALEEYCPAEGTIACVRLVFFTLLNAFIHIFQGMEDDRLFSLTFLGDFEAMIGINCLAIQWGHGSGEPC